MTEIIHPSLDKAHLVREIGGARVLRLATLEPYHVDWVQFTPDRPTPLHDHPGIEHHLVGAGCVRGHYHDEQREYGPLDYFFWDGRRKHTSYSANRRPAGMMMVRAANPRAPDRDFHVVDANDGACDAYFDDGLGQVGIGHLTAGQTRVSIARLLVLMGAAGTCVRIGRRQIAGQENRPVVLCRNQGAAIEIAAAAPLAWLELDA